MCMRKVENVKNEVTVRNVYTYACVRTSLIMDMVCGNNLLKMVLPYYYLNLKSTICT